MMQFNPILVVMASMVAACYAQNLQAAGASFVPLPFPGRTCRAVTSSLSTVKVNPEPLYIINNGYITIYWQCTVRKPKNTRCNGYCENYDTTNPVSLKECKCCKPTMWRKVVPRQICRVIRCKLPFGPCTGYSGYHPNPRPYYVIASCSCQTCPGNNYALEYAKRSRGTVDTASRLPENAKMEDADIEEVLEELKKDKSISEDSELSSQLSSLSVKG